MLSILRNDRKPILRVGTKALAFFTASGLCAQPDPIAVRFEPGCESVKAYFDNSVTSALSYLWDFGDGETSTLPRPTHEFTFGEPVSVQLTTTHQGGTSFTFEKNFTTQEQLEFASITLPNVFTPNGDGRNDLFGPMTDHRLGPCAELIVFNRYGQRVFDSAGTALSWDGRTFAGEPASDGVYFYTFTWGGGSLNSTVTLVR